MRRPAALGHVLAVLAVAGFVGSAAARDHGTVVLSNSTAYVDPTGDATSGDITTVMVADDPATGAITITATVTGLPQSGGGAAVVLDADADETTGMGGFDYAFVYVQAGDDRVWQILKMTSTSAETLPPTSAETMMVDGDRYVWTFAKGDLGIGAGFDFGIGTQELGEDGSTRPLDEAPDVGIWSYAVQPSVTTATTTTPAAAGKPVVATPKAVPLRPVAGGRFAARFAVTSSTTGRPLTRGKLILEPSVSGKLLPHAEQFRNGVASVSLGIPSSAKGKLLSVKVMISADGQMGGRISTFRVR